MLGDLDLGLPGLLRCFGVRFNRTVLVGFSLNSVTLGDSLGCSVESGE